MRQICGSQQVTRGVVGFEGKAFSSFFGWGSWEISLLAVKRSCLCAVATLRDDVTDDLDYLVRHVYGVER